MTPEEFTMKAQADFRLKKVAEVYTEYQKQLHSTNALDFDDLICKTVELFQSCPEVLEYYQEQFRFIMVDEYQDTNTAQFKLVSLLAVQIRQSLRGGRRRPVDLQIPRRKYRQYSEL